MLAADWLQNATRQLKDADIPTARLDCLVLLEDVTSHDRAYLLVHDELKLTDKQLAELNSYIERRAQHEPLAYIRQKTEFYGRSFYVDKGVLEPRPESETMIDLLKTLPVTTILDVGTGSGALGITAALELPNVRVSLLELDSDAAAVATHNVKLFNLDLPLLMSNLLNNAPGHYDALLCNLPYVPNSHTINKAATHEPPLAIFGGNDGLDLYRRLFAQADATYVLTESLPPQHEALAAIALEHGYMLTKTDDFIQLFQHTQKF